MKCYLSGMPELRLGLNDKVMFENTGRGEPKLVYIRSKLADCSQSFLSKPRQVCRDGRRQIPSMRETGKIRKRPNDIFHSSGWRIRAHVVPPVNSCEAVDLGRGGSGEPSRQQSGVYGEDQGSIQEKKHSKQCGNLRARARRRGQPEIQGKTLLEGAYRLSY